MALNLGLNIDCSDGVASGHISAEEAEVRKVTWWGCFILDKYLCLHPRYMITVLTCY
jgi:hypothetical protein